MYKADFYESYGRRPLLVPSAQDSTFCTVRRMCTKQHENLYKREERRDDILHNLQNAFRYKIGTITRQRRDNVTKDERANWIAMSGPYLYPPGSTVYVMSSLSFALPLRCNTVYVTIEVR